MAAVKPDACSRYPVHHAGTTHGFSRQSMRATPSQTSEAMIRVVMIHLMVRRLARAVYF
jgi:hypothetical protein